MAVWKNEHSDLRQIGLTRMERLQTFTRWKIWEKPFLCHLLWLQHERKIQRPGFPNILYLHNQLCSTIYLPAECRAACKMQQLHQEVKRDRKKIFFCFTSIHSLQFCSNHLEKSILLGEILSLSNLQFHVAIKMKGLFSLNMPN